MSKQNVIEFDAELWELWCDTPITHPNSIKTAQLRVVKKYGSKRISLMKWHADNPNRGSGYCALCVSSKSSSTKASFCVQCPLLKHKVCKNWRGLGDSVYWLWDSACVEGRQSDIKKYADLMFKAISEIEED